MVYTSIKAINIKLFFIFIILVTYLKPAELKLGAAGQKSISFKCNRIFELRKKELLEISRNINDQQQTLEAEKLASDNVMKIKDKKLKEKEKDLAIVQRVLESREANLKKLLAENKRILAIIEKKLSDRIRESFELMPPGKAAGVLQVMSNERAAGIMFGMIPSKIGEIFSKMNPVDASKVSLIIKRGPPFKTSKKYFIIKKPKELIKNIEQDFEVN
jgi:flagellar motility protein MotE (MotC chaperone)